MKHNPWPNMVPEALKIQPLLEPLENNLKQTEQQHSNWYPYSPTAFTAVRLHVGFVTTHAKD